jgi:hypothetical protein
VIRYRSDAQVLASAEQMDAALAAGLSPDALAALVEMRAAWHDTGALPAVSTDVAAVLGHPAAGEWDAVFIAALRRKLSAPTGSVPS